MMHESSSAHIGRGELLPRCLWRVRACSFALTARGISRRSLDILVVRVYNFYRTHASAAFRWIGRGDNADDEPSGPVYVWPIPTNSLV